MGLFKRQSDSPDTKNRPDVTGDWEGHYTQHGEQCPIKATLKQEGNQLSGTMTDTQTETERSLFDAAAEAGLPPGADEQFDEQIRQMIPNAPKGPILAKSVLPEQSQLDGTVDGGFVRFTKVYQGEHFVGFQVGDKGVGEVIEQHSVQYSGRLSADGKTIEGQWTIYQQEAQRGYIDGLFVLRKV